jgi:hypothetical protein
MNIRCKWPRMAWLLVLAAGTAAAAEANPEDGKIVAGVYSNPYFGLTFPLPAGYGRGLDPAPPSGSGYYVLNTPSHLDGPGPSILIAAQDMFFVPKAPANAMAMVEGLQRSTEKTGVYKTDVPPSEIKIGGHGFARLRNVGDALSRLVVATDIRCHIVNITLTASDPAVLDQLAASLDRITVPADASATADGTNETGKPYPVCIKEYVKPETTLHRVEPALASQKYMKIPVRIIIGKDGKVKHVHVIRAQPGDKRNIEDALAQWKFKPYAVKGQPVEVETGLEFSN